MKDLLLLWDLAPPSIMDGDPDSILLLIVIILVTIGVIVVFITWYKRTKTKKIEAPEISTFNDNKTKNI